MQGKFITLEGSEGAGKSTVLRFIQSYLTQAQIKFELTREPGGTPLAEEIRRVLLHPGIDETMQPLTELLLMFASRAQLIQTVIQPALAAGCWVVSDRYVDASYAYQGGGRMVALENIQLLDQMVVQDTYPDLTLLLDLPAELGILRAGERGTERDRIEKEKMDFFERVRTGYLQRAHEDPARIKIIDASQPLAAVQAQVATILTDLMAK
jgi:dTMP kinase